MKLRIRKRIVQYGGPLMWVWWCGREPEGPRCAMSKYGHRKWIMALTDAFQHAYDKHRVVLGDPLSDEGTREGQNR